MEKVQVIMSTYNGMKYIDEQIQSILNQKDVLIDLLIRDDNSTDGTYEYIKDTYKQIKIFQGNNLGSTQSFFEALEKSENYKYYAFADQDDVWHPDKLFIAISKLKEHENQNLPLLYCSNLTVTDVTLKPLYLMHKRNFNTNYRKSLIENISNGCTIVFNNIAKEYALQYIPKVALHDWWLNLICCYFGECVYDENSYILYRQHANNQVGGARDFKNVWKKRLKNFNTFKNYHYRNHSAEEFLIAYNDLLTQSQKEIISKVSCYNESIMKKILLFFDIRYRMCTLDRDLGYRIRIIFSCI